MHIEAGAEQLIRDVAIVRAQMGLGLTHRELSDVLKCCAKRQVLIINSQKGEPIGYVAYARISKYTLFMLKKNPVASLRFEEMAEGGLFFIMDMAVNPYHSNYVMGELKRLLRNKRVVCGVKKGSLRILKKNQASFTRVQLHVEDRPVVAGKDKDFKLRAA